jgi:hypothetical protein
MQNWLIRIPEVQRGPAMGTHAESAVWSVSRGTGFARASGWL